MARKLPWATPSDTSKASARRAPAAQAPKREPSTSSADDESSKNKAATLAQSKSKYEVTPQKKGGSRSPSSSPIRAPPNASPMRPGYDQDDIYIMVEDELQAVAQTYTYHLHAAEYKRLKKKAREAPPRTLPDLKKDAPKGVKRKFEILALQAKQNMTLADGDEDENARPNDPWLGTSLAGLMGSSSQPKRTLTLSEEIPSSTRAASGYGRGKGESPSKKMKTAVIETESRSKPEPTPAQESRITSINVPISKAQGGRSGTRILAADTAAFFKAAVTDTEITSNSSRASEVKDTKTAEAVSKFGRLKPAARQAKKRFSFDDDFDIDSVAAVEPQSSSAKPAGKRKLKIGEKDENKRTKINDIPTFLV